jgi:tetratricopeptide (TPR) repeat protein
LADVVEELEQAVSLFIRGRSEEAVEIGRRLLTRARGTEHAASVYRHMSEFLHAIGNYPDARNLAQEAGSLARAIRHPGEILASSLATLSCDLYLGEVTSVYREIGQLLRLVTDQPLPRIFMGQVMLIVGDLDQAVEHLQDTRTLLDQLAPEGSHAQTDLYRVQLLTSVGKAHLLADRPREAASVLERAMDLEVSTLVPGTLARAMLGLAFARLGDEEQGRELIEQATGLARKISRDVHGHALALAGITRLSLGEIGTAAEQLQAAVGLLTHALERQESFCALGEISSMLGEDADAVLAFRRATEPTSESYFGRMGIKALKKLVGFKVV